MLSQGKYKKAISFYKKALKINPGYAEGHSNIGAALARQERIDEAILEYEKALKINPNFAEANYSMGNILLLQSAAGLIPITMAILRMVSMAGDLMWLKW